VKAPSALITRTEELKTLLTAFVRSRQELLKQFESAIVRLIA
jgi:hypothetical protein